MSGGIKHSDPFFKAFQEALGDHEINFPESQMHTEWEQLSQNIATPPAKTFFNGLESISLKSAAIIGSGAVIISAAVIIGLSVLKDDVSTQDTGVYFDEGQITISDEIVSESSETPENTIIISTNDTEPEIDAIRKEKVEKTYPSSTDASSDRISRVSVKYASDPKPSKVTPPTSILQAVKFSDSLICLNKSLVISYRKEQDAATIKLTLPDREINDLSGTLSYKFAEAGTYRIMMKDELSNTRIQHIHVFNEPVSDFATDDAEMPTIRFINRSRNADSYRWLFEEDQASELKNPQYTFTRSGNYTVRLITQNRYGCQHEFSRNINVIVEEGAFKEPYIPNRFSPNGDGLNDYYYIGIEDEIFFQLTIVDRHGALVFTADSKDKKWNGSNEGNGKACPEGSYFYVFQYKLRGQAQIVKKIGTIYLEK